MGNRPVDMVDPDGKWVHIVAGAVVALFTTDVGYDIQKFISPVAAKLDLKFGSHQNGIGLDVSVGRCLCILRTVTTSTFQFTIGWFVGRMSAFGPKPRLEIPFSFARPEKGKNASF
jgi:hypothetical protein